MSWHDANVVKNGPRARGATLRGDQGAAALEFALVSIVLLTLVIGIIQYAFFFWQLAVAERSLQEAAEIVSYGTLEDTSGNGTACDEWRDALQATRATNDDYVYSWTPVSGTSAPMARNDQATVVVAFRTYDFGLLPVPRPGTAQQTVTLEQAPALSEYTSAAGCPAP